VFIPPQLPGDFYSEHPVLDHIRRAAYAQQLNPPAPDAVLGVCLARVAALVPLATTLPGVGGTVNFIVGLVGLSGAGKSTAQRLARYLIPNLGEKTRDSVPVGSGEGMVEAYLRTATVDGVKTKVQQFDAAYYYVDEAEAFINRARSDGSTTLATLRTLWSGADAGALNAQTETTRHVEDSSYRFSAVFGFQPTYAMQLIRDDKAGTPQRFLFVSANDRGMPDIPGANPGPLNVMPPPPGEIFVDREIIRHVSERRRKVQRGELVLTPLDAHRDFVRLRTAYLLAVLCGDHSGITPKWWNLAGRMLDTSHEIIAALYDDALAAAAKDDDLRIEERINSREAEAEKKMHRMGARLAGYAREAGEPSTWPALSRNLNGGERRAYPSADPFVNLGYLRYAGNNRYVAASR
jgi:hypothetical protein